MFFFWSSLDFLMIQWMLAIWSLVPLPFLSSVHFSRSVVSDSLRPHGPQHARLPCPSQLPEFTQTHIHWVSDTIQPSHPMSSPSPPAFNHSKHQGLFKWVLRIRCPKYCSLSFSISLSNEYSGLISFRMDWLVLLAVQGTLKSLKGAPAKKTIWTEFRAIYIINKYFLDSEELALEKDKLW